MNRRRSPMAKCIPVSLVLAAFAAGDALAARKEAPGALPASTYYKVTPVFIPYPEPGKSWAIRQYGPVGIGLELKKNGEKDFELWPLHASIV